MPPSASGGTGWGRLRCSVYTLVARDCGSWLRNFRARTLCADSFSEGKQGGAGWCWGVEGGGPCTQQLGGRLLAPSTAGLFQSKSPATVTRLCWGTSRFPQGFPRVPLRRSVGGFRAAGRHGIQPLDFKC